MKNAFLSTSLRTGILLWRQSCPLFKNLIYLTPAEQRDMRPKSTHVSKVLLLPLLLLSPACLTSKTLLTEVERLCQRVHGALSQAAILGSNSADWRQEREGSNDGLGEDNGVPEGERWNGRSEKGILLRRGVIQNDQVRRRHCRQQREKKKCWASKENSEQNRKGGEGIGRRSR